jgi:hypothetical protein
MAAPSLVQRIPDTSEPQFLSPTGTFPLGELGQRASALDPWRAPLSLPLGEHAHWRPPFSFSSPTSPTSPLVLTADLLGPVVCALPGSLGCSITGESFSIAEHLHRCLERELFEDPLTEYGSTDEDEDMPSDLDGEEPGNAQPGAARLSRVERGKLSRELSNKLSRAQRRALHKKDRRNRRRKGKGATEKSHMDKHRRWSAQAPILTGFSPAASPDVTAPGWVGKQLEALPRCTLGLEGLLTTYPKLTVFPWDGK